jgi:hypothetical protein
MELFHYSSMHLRGDHRFNFNFLPCHHYCPKLRCRSVLNSVQSSNYYIVSVKECSQLEDFKRLDTESTFPPIAARWSKGHWFLEDSQVSSICPADKNDV